MSTETPTTDPRELTDEERAWRHFEAGTPFEPDLARRIQERSRRAMQANFEASGYVDVDALLRDEEP